MFVSNVYLKKGYKQSKCAALETVAHSDGQYGTCLHYVETFVHSFLIFIKISIKITPKMLLFACVVIHVFYYLHNNKATENLNMQIK